MPDQKRLAIVVWVVPLLVGLVGIYRVMHSAGFAMYRTVDIVQFLGSGMCFGVALTGAIFMFRRSRL